MGVTAVYDGWQRIQTRLVDRLPALTADDLRLRGAPDAWPVWALISHLAFVRVYWLCTIFGEPGAEATPWAEPDAPGWEDLPDRPRDARELLFAVESTWRVVESCLERWTVDSLDVEVTREVDGAVRRMSRQAVLTRLLIHDAFHTGEVSLLLGMHARPSLDPWELAR